MTTGAFLRFHTASIRKVTAPVVRRSRKICGIDSQLLLSALRKLGVDERCFFVLSVFAMAYQGEECRCRKIVAFALCGQPLGQ